MKHIDGFDSVHLKITNILDDLIIYDNDLLQQSFYSPKLQENGQYEVKLTETTDGTTKEYTKVVIVNKTKAEMPYYVTNPEQNEEAKILISDIDKLRAGETVDENGKITVDPSIASYDKISASDFADYCNSLPEDKVYRVFASDGERQYGGFFSKSKGNEIYDLTIDAYSWEDINNPMPLTLPNITINDVKSHATQIKVNDSSFRLKDSSSTGGYAAYEVYLPDSYVGTNAPDARFRISVTGTSKISMKLWSSTKSNEAKLMRTITSSNNTNTASIDIYTSDYKKTASWLSFYVMVYFPSATDGYGMINVEPISGYDDDVTGSIYAAYNGDSLYRELSNTQFTMLDSWDVDAFCIDYWGTNNVVYKAEIKNRSLADQAKLDSGQYAKGSNEKFVTLWSVAEEGNILTWSSNSVYTIPKNTDMAFYCMPVDRTYDRVITIQHNPNLGVTSSEYYQFAYKMMG